MSLSKQPYLEESEDEEDFLRIKTIHSDDEDDDTAEHKTSGGGKVSVPPQDDDDDDEEMLDLSKLRKHNKQSKSKNVSSLPARNGASKKKDKKKPEEDAGMFDDMADEVTSSKGGLTMEQKVGNSNNNLNKKTFAEYDVLSDLAPETNSQISTADITIALIQERREARLKKATENPSSENDKGENQEASESDNESEDSDDQDGDTSEGESESSGSSADDEDDQEDDANGQKQPTSTDGNIDASKSANMNLENSAALQSETRDILQQDISKRRKKSGIDFGDMHLSPPLLKVINHLGYKSPTPIQERTIPIALEGKDICGSAVTGSGKTAAFLLPVLQRLLWAPRNVPATRVLIVTPTRELASQCHAVAKQLAQYTNIRCSRIVGGLSLQSQEQELQTQPDIVICTPGRMIDHLRNTKNVDISDVGVLVLDEADRLLELGFAEELKELVEYCPTNRQTMLFSATLTDKVDDLAKLSLKNPVRVSADPLYDMAQTLTQEFIRIRRSKEKDKEAILLSLVSRSFKQNVIVFCGHKRTAHRLLLILGLSGFNARELHGNLTQRQRLEALEMFRKGKVDMLVATDLAARGLDIPHVSAVINFDMPKDMTNYVHRVGRTARAGRSGRSVTMCSENDRLLMKEIVKRASRNVMSRNVPEDVISYWNRHINDLQPDIEDILQQEDMERRLRIADMEAKKAQNLVNHAEEIHSRPVRTWFQTPGEKKSIQERAKQIAEERVAVVSGKDSNTDKAQQEEKPRKPTRKEMKVLEQAEKNKKPHRLTRKKRRRLETERELAKEESKARRAEKQEKARDNAAKSEGETRNLNSEEVAAAGSREKIFREVNALKGQKSHAKKQKRGKSGSSSMNDHSDSYVDMSELADVGAAERKPRFLTKGSSETKGIERRKTSQSQLKQEERKELENGIQPGKSLRKGGKVSRNAFKSKAKHRRR